MPVSVSHVTRAASCSSLYLSVPSGRFGSTGVTMTPAFAPAVHALRAAHASVFVLDVTSADYHSLETGLQMVAGATGGAYYSTYRLPALATRTLAQACRCAGRNVGLTWPGSLEAAP